MFDLTGRVAVITGASRGLGRQDALTLARQGADVVITDVLVEDDPELQKTAEAQGSMLAQVAVSQGWVHSNSTAEEIRKMGRNAVSSNELFIDNLEVPVEDRVGEEGKGFQYILDGLNPERMLIAAEALGIGRVALEKAVKYGNEREVFGRPIGMNQGIQFPLADSLARLDAAELMLRKATWLYDNGKPCGREANTAKYLCADAGFTAADRALQTHGGMGYAEEYHIARYFREARLMKIAPVSQEMILNFLGSNVLKLPRSY